MTINLRARLWGWFRMDARLAEAFAPMRAELAQYKLAMRQEFKGELNALAAEVAKQKPRLAPVEHAEFTDPHLGRL